MCKKINIFIIPANVGVHRPYTGNIAATPPGEGVRVSMPQSNAEVFRYENGAKLDTFLIWNEGGGFEMTNEYIISMRIGKCGWFWVDNMDIFSINWFLFAFYLQKWGKSESKMGKTYADL